MKKKTKKNGYKAKAKSGPKAAARPARTSMRVGGSASRTAPTTRKTVAPPSRGGRGGR
jgi:hypothetical protein